MLEILRCPGCGVSVDKSDRKCRHCGSVLLLTGLDQAGPGRPETDAATTWRAVLEKDPTDAEANHALGLILVSSGLPGNAIPHFRAAVLAAPEAARYRFNLALALFRGGEVDLTGPQLDEAIDSISACRRLDPDLREGEAFEHFFLGIRLESIDPDEALIEYRKAIAVAPDLSVLHYLMGVRLRNDGRFEEAEAAARAATSLSPRHFNAHLLRTEALLLLERWREALSAAEEAGRCAHADFHRALAFRWAARARHGLGQLQEAIAAAKRALALSPGDAELREELASYVAAMPGPQPEARGASKFGGCMISLLVISVLSGMFFSSLAADGFGKVGLALGLIPAVMFYASALRGRYHGRLVSLGSVGRGTLVAIIQFLICWLLGWLLLEH